MDHRDHVELIRPAVAPSGASVPDASRPTWADIGAGEGALTLALADLPGAARNASRVGRRDRQVDVVRQLASHLRPGGAFVVVEYDADHGNPWVPNPFTFATWQRMADAR